MAADLGWRKGGGAAEAVGAHIVEAVQVVGVAVGEEHAIDAVDAVAERLGSEIGAGIDEDRMTAVLQV